MLDLIRDSVSKLETWALLGVPAHKNQMFIRATYVGHNAESPVKQQMSNTNTSSRSTADYLRNECDQPAAFLKHNKH